MKIQAHFGTLTRKYGIYLMLLALIIACSIISPFFLTSRNIISVARQISITGILAFGQTLLIISGCIDLSQGSVVALAGMISINVFLATGSFVLAFLSSIATAVLCGLINGILVTKIRLPSFIATMAMDNIARGSVYLYTGGHPIYQIGDLGRASRGYIGFMPIPVIFLLAITVFCWILLSQTTLGRNFYATGGNAEAANASGINVARTKIIAFMLCGLFVGIAGVLHMARLNSGMPETGVGYHGDAIAATVIGGTSFTGGIGTAWGTLVGAFIIGIISNILNLAGVQSYVQQIVKGVIIIAAVGFDLLGKHRRIKKLSVAEKLKTTPLGGFIKS